MNQAVWITGAGTTTTLGNDYRSVVENLLAGRSGVGPVRSFDVSQHPSQIAAQLVRVPCPLGWDAGDFAAKCRLEQCALWCCSSALRDAGLWERRGDLRIGLILGFGAEWIHNWEMAESAATPSTVDRPDLEPPSYLTTVQHALNVEGPAVLLSTACASGNQALALGRRWLQLGWVDLCLAGACDMNVTPLCLAGFGNLRALSRRNDEPARASRPFDKDRDGFVIGEGGAVFVLETETLARRRGARAYAELASCGTSSDAFHLVIPSTDPGPPSRAVHRALAEAGLNPADVDYVNAHGTGTPAGDVAESVVLHGIFGAAIRDVPVSSTKSMTGHLLTAASAVEAIACLGAIERQMLPPTINLDHPDPHCDLCHVPHVARPHKVKVAISNAFGFGGSNSCAVFRAVS